MYILFLTKAGQCSSKTRITSNVFDNFKDMFDKKKKEDEAAPPYKRPTNIYDANF